MRKAITRAAIVLLIIGAIPLLMGFIVERDIHNLIDHANSSRDMVTTLKNYQRGWLKSTAKIEVRFKNNDAQFTDGDLIILADETIHHGLIFRDGKGFGVGRGLLESKLILPSDVNATLNLLFGSAEKQPQLLHRTKISLLRDLDTTISIPAFNLSRPGQGTLNWLGLDGDLLVSSNYKTAKGNLVFNGLNITSPMLNLVMKDIRAKYDVENTDEANGVAHFNYAQPLVDISFFNQHLFQMTDFTLKTDTSLQANLLSQSIVANVGPTFIKDVAFGPGTLEMSLTNLDAEPLTGLSNAIQAQYASGVTPEQRDDALGKIFANSMPKILAKNPQFTLKKFRMHFAPDGDLAVTGSVSLKPMAPDMNARTFLKSPESWVITAHIEVDKPVLESMLTKSIMGDLKQQQATVDMVAKQQEAIHQETSPSETLSDDALLAKAKEGVAEQFKLWESTGYMKCTDNKCVTDIKAEGGKLTMNGQEIPYK